MEQKVITIIGGSGFLGSYIVRQLAQAGYRIRVISRNPNAAGALRTAGDVGQVVLMKGNLSEPDKLAPMLERSYAVISLVGILYESGRQRFTTLHSQGPEKLAQLAKAAGVKRFIHVSALGVDKAGDSRYARTKLLGEKAVLAAFPDATIIRPSIVFGPEDKFYNLFARLAMIAPALPLVGGGNTRFQPVYAGDIAKGIEAILSRDDTKGKIFEFGGPHVYSFKEILEYILRATNRHTVLMPLPFPLASVVGTIREKFPKPSITRDQVALLRHDSIVNPGAQTLAHLNINPTAVDTIVPNYLARFAKGGLKAA